MKRIVLLLLFLLLLSACEKSLAAKLEDLSYMSEDIELIETLSEEHQLLFLEEKNERALVYLHTSGFEEEHLDDYLKYDDMAKEEKIVKLVNEGKLNDANREKIEKMLSVTSKRTKIFILNISAAMIRSGLLSKRSIRFATRSSIRISNLSIWIREI